MSIQRLPSPALLLDHGPRTDPQSCRCTTQDYSVVNSKNPSNVQFKSVLPPFSTPYDTQDSLRCITMFTDSAQDRLIAAFAFLVEASCAAHHQDETSKCPCSMVPRLSIDFGRHSSTSVQAPPPLPEMEFAVPTLSLYPQPFDPTTMKTPPSRLRAAIPNWIQAHYPRPSRSSVCSRFQYWKSLRSLVQARHQSQAIYVHN